MNVGRPSGQIAGAKGSVVPRLFGALLFALAQLVFSGLSRAASLPHSPKPSYGQLAIVIDDLGYSRASGLRAARLPGPLTYAVLPFTPYGGLLSELLHRRGREVILHLPMEPAGPGHPGPGAIRTSMAPATVVTSVRAALAAVPHAAGISNHMGSRATADRRIMDLVMHTLEEWDPSPRRPEPRPAATRPGLFYLDSRTTALSVSGPAAERYHVTHLARDVFLDNARDRRLIEVQIGKAVGLVKKRGEAIAIGHPYPETLEVLERVLPRLLEVGIALAPVSELASHRMAFHRLAAETTGKASGSNEALEN